MNMTSDSKDNIFPRRIVITGLGVVTPLGHSPGTLFSRLYDNQSAIKPITHFDAEHHLIKYAGEINDFDLAPYGFDKKDITHLDKVQQFALAACEQAIIDAGLDLPRQHLSGNKKTLKTNFRFGTAIGTSNTMFDPVYAAALHISKKNIKKVSPRTLNKSRPCSSASLVSIRYGLIGPILSQNGASATGALNLIAAVDNIRLGRSDVMLAGGADSGVNELYCAVFGQNLSASRSGAFRPFDKNGDGMLLGEGSAILVLEEAEHAQKRNAPIYGEILGCGARSDAYDMSQIPSNAPGLCASLYEALAESNLSNCQIDYINTHSTANKMNDVAESNAINTVFSDTKKPYVSGTKAALGHMLAGSGAVELVITLLSSCYDAIPPTHGLREINPQCNVNIVHGQGKRVQVEHALSTNIGLGGLNSAIVVKGVKRNWLPSV